MAVGDVGEAARRALARISATIWRALESGEMGRGGVAGGGVGVGSSSDDEDVAGEET